MEYALIAIGLALIVFSQPLARAFNSMNRKLAGEAFTASPWVYVAVGITWILLAVLTLIFGPNLRFF